MISQPSQSLSQLTQSQQLQSQSPRHGCEDQQKHGCQEVLSHKGPFAKKDKDNLAHRNCAHSVLVDVAGWETLSGDVMKNLDLIAANTVDKDLFKLTEQSQLWVANKVKNEIKKNCPEHHAKEKCSPNLSTSCHDGVWK